MVQEFQRPTPTDEPESRAKKGPPAGAHDEVTLARREAGSLAPKEGANGRNDPDMAIVITALPARQQEMPAMETMDLDEGITALRLLAQRPGIPPTETMDLG